METIHFILIIIGGLSCLVLLYQDLRGRWIHALPVSILGVAGLTFTFLKAREDIWLNLIVIAGFLTLILGIAWLVMKIRHPNEQLMSSQLGWGDVVFFFAMAGWFDPLGYALFFVTGLLIVLLGVGIMMWRGSWQENHPIPLAGLLGGYAIVFAPLYWHFENAIAAWVIS